VSLIRRRKKKEEEQKENCFLAACRLGDISFRVGDESVFCLDYYYYY